jgi:hypothetical protein
MKILKYTIDPLARTTFCFVPDSRVLKVAEQDGEIRLWALTEPWTPGPDADRWDQWEILVFGTGEEIPAELLADYDHLDTVQMPGGLVWHVFCQWTPVR